MKKRSLKAMALLMSMLMGISIFAGCSGKDKTPKDSVSNIESKGDKNDEILDSEETKEPDSKGDELPEPNEMPIVEEKIKLTMFTTFSAGHAEQYETLNDSPNMQALEEATNIEVEILGVPSSNYMERKNLMFASRDLPDIIYSNDVQGDSLLYGVEDNLIIPLDDLIEKYAYYFNQWLDYEPAIRKQSEAVDGKMYHMPYTDISLHNIVQAGYYIREAWLEEFDIEPPETLDELYDVLKLFKEKDPAGGGNTIPLSAPSVGYITIPILGSYGTKKGIYRVDDKIKYGPIEPEFKEALKYLNKLYSEGLIASDYLTHDLKVYNANLPDNIGITCGYTNSALRTPLQASGLTVMEIMNQWRPISGMKGPDGNYYWFVADIGNVVNKNLGEFISSSNEHPIETIKWMDYKYSKEGSYTMNLGKRGLTWDLDDDGVPYMTDFVLNNPDGLTPEETLAKNGQMIWAYTTGIAGLSRVAPTTNWPYTYDDIDYNRTTIGPNPESLYSKYLDNWRDFDASRQLPPEIRYTNEEQEQISILAQDINTYVDENMHRFIMGLEPIEKWDDVVKQLKNIEVDKYIQIHQDALDRVK